MVHLIFVCKYRKKLLVKFGNQIKDLFYDIAEEKGFEILEMEIDKDHMHLLVKYEPNVSILQIVRWIKQISTYRIWRTTENKTYLSKHFWKENTFLSDGYFACSIGVVSEETIRKYIQKSIVMYSDSSLV